MIVDWGSPIDAIAILVVGCLGVQFRSPQVVPLAGAGLSGQFVRTADERASRYWSD